tara:strand:+ start:1209 stop:1697 length:489 start_codon:yes stop_codon:yes gene_type:complete
MSGEEKLNEFTQAIDEWISCKNIISPDGPKKNLEGEYKGNISRILNLTSETLRILTGEQCLSYAYELHNYGEYLESVKVKENAILEWADSSIWYIISTVMQNYGSQYTKWQEKYYSAIKENPLASDILKVKNHAEARVKILNGKADRIQSMANILTNLSRRR